MSQAQYPIGTPGQPWGAEERALWRAQQQIKRSYHDEVEAPLQQLAGKFELFQYGELNYPEGNYHLWGAQSHAWNEHLPTVLVTGGVHGYETSGVQGALRFLQSVAVDYAGKINLVVLPCVSPWGYETINRWNPEANDPNRSFVKGSGVAEAEAVVNYLAESSLMPVLHIDLHETTDTDNSEFRPALAARNGTVNHNWNIPDGFYTVGDTERDQVDFQAAIIAGVAQVTHIAEADEEGKLIGEPMQQHGVINYPVKSLNLCAGVTDAPYVSTTEVYPDSPRTNPENCIEAQVAAVTAAIDYILAHAD